MRDFAPVILSAMGREDESGQWTAADLLFQYGTVAECVLYAGLFWPAFVEVDGSVLLAEWNDNIGDRFRALRLNERLSVSEIEDFVNRIDLAYAFSSRNKSIEGLPMLADLLVETWAAKLSREFLGRRFSVNISERDEGDLISISFFEVRGQYPDSNDA